MKLPHRQFLHLAAGATALPAVSRTAAAQTYPTRPVRIIVGFPAGGTAGAAIRDKVLPAGLEHSPLRGRAAQEEHESLGCLPQPIRRPLTRFGETCRLLPRMLPRKGLLPGHRCKSPLILVSPAGIEPATY